MQEKLEIYKHTLEIENQKHNLVSRKAKAADLDQHIADSSKVLDYCDLTGKKVVDIGSGAGFPGLIIALICPQAEFVLIEADLKKSRFLQETINQLELKQVSVINERVEAVGQNQNYRSQFDVCTARAVSTINVLLEYGLPLLKKQGRMILWKGKNWQAELQSAQAALSLLGGEYKKTYTYYLGSERLRALLEFEKTETTPDQYPRRIGIPVKRPL